MGRFQFSSSSLDISVKNLDKYDFKYLSNYFNSEVMYLVNQKELYPYEYMNGFKRFKEGFPRKEKFYSSLAGIKKW